MPYCNQSGLSTIEVLITLMIVMSCFLPLPMLYLKFKHKLCWLQQKNLALLELQSISEKLRLDFAHHQQQMNSWKQQLKARLPNATGELSCQQLTCKIKITWGNHEVATSRL